VLVVLTAGPQAASGSPARLHRHLHGRYERDLRILPDLAAGAVSACPGGGKRERASGCAPTRDLLYAVNEIDTYEGKPSGSVSAFAIDRDTGALRALNRQSSVGSGPAHLIGTMAGNLARTTEAEASRCFRSDPTAR
jgi:hypothetical protein